MTLLSEYLDAGTLLIINGLIALLGTGAGLCRAAHRQSRNRRGAMFLAAGYALMALGFGVLISPIFIPGLGSGALWGNALLDLGTIANFWRSMPYSIGAGGILGAASSDRHGDCRIGDRGADRPGHARHGCVGRWVARVRDHGDRLFTVALQRSVAAPDRLDPGRVSRCVGGHAGAAHRLVAGQQRKWRWARSNIGVRVDRAALAHRAITPCYLWMIKREVDAELIRYARQDPLTGVANRRVVWQMGEARCNRGRGKVGVIAIDIDHFKQINDRYGHGSGDAMLRLVADVLAQNLRSGDVLGRIGGEEFLILLADEAVEMRAALAERLRQAVADAALTLPDGQPLSCTISLGHAAVALPGPGWDATVQAADRALYAAKHGGRNRVMDAAQLAA
jgi:diguanylate cyclase (GGDEF)-like protein